MFSIMSQHMPLFGVPSSWTYFEAGHGKGPCDGIGGSSKRSADNAVRRDEVIKNAEQYVNVLNSRENTVVTHILVSTEAVREAGDALAEMEAAAKVHGTMLIHAAVSSQPGKLHTRSVSCFKGVAFPVPPFCLAVPAGVGTCFIQT